MCKVSKYILVWIIVSILLSTSVFGQKSQTDSLQHLLKTTKEPSEKAVLHNLLAVKIRRFNIDSALIHARLAEKFARESDNREQLAISYKNIGNYHYLNYELNEAKKYYQYALDIFITLKDSIGIANVYNNLGATSKMQGLLSKAMDYYLQSIKYREHTSDSKRVFKTLMNIGNIHVDLGDFDLGIEYYTRASNLAKSIDNLTGVAKCNTHIGLVRLDQGKYSEAISHFQNALAYFKTIKDKQGLGHSYSSIGVAYLRMHMFFEAEEYLNKALSFFNELNNRQSISMTLIELAEAYNGQKKYHKAIEKAQEGLSMAREAKSLMVIRDAHQQLSFAYEKLVNHQHALLHYKKLLSLKDSILNVEKIREIEDIEHRYQMENQELKIKNLEKDNALKKVKLEQLRTQQVFTYGAFAVALLFIAGLLFTRTKLRRKNHTIYEQNKELEKHRHKLEELVQERTIELEEAKEKAEESDRLKSSFLTNMSHEIRTPMNAIVGFTELLNFTDTSEENRIEYRKLINQNSEVLLHLIDDIMDIAKIEANQINISKEETNITEVVNNVISIFQNQRKEIKKEHIDIRCLSCQEQDTTIQTDPIRLQQILSNLVDNALKFTEEGYVEVGYKIKNENSSSKVVFYVKDTGIGLEKNQMERIFRRFEKAREGRQKLYRGAGLGLSICKDFIEFMGGEIWVKSNIGEGATFFFSLPA